MESHEHIKQRNLFLAEIVPYVQIEKNDFIERVAKRECYEWTIYRWIMRLFDKGTPIDEAITIIHRTRRMVLIHRTRNAYEAHSDISNENLHKMLSQYPKYNQLSPNQKKQVQEKIAARFNHMARFEAIEQVLEEMNPEVKREKETEDLSILKVTANRIMDMVRQWNLTEYWEKKKRNRPK